MGSYNSTNRVWGTCKNPHNPERTCGGSSGGDAALVAARCTPWALGGDLAGSVRVPSEYNGVYGFKPTNGRSTVIGVNLGVFPKSSCL